MTTTTPTHEQILRAWLNLQPGATALVSAAATATSLPAAAIEAVAHKDWGLSLSVRHGVRVIAINPHGDAKRSAVAVEFLKRMDAITTGASTAPISAPAKHA